MPRIARKTFAALILGTALIATGPAAAAMSQNGIDNGWQNGWANGTYYNGTSYNGTHYQGWSNGTQFQGWSNGTFYNGTVYQGWTNGTMYNGAGNGVGNGQTTPADGHALRIIGIELPR